MTTFSGHGINGPWDMTAVNLGRVADLFVTNVLNGTVRAALPPASSQRHSRADGSPGDRATARHDSLGQVQ